MAGCNTKECLRNPRGLEEHCGTRALLGFTAKVNGKKLAVCKQGAEGINEVSLGWFVCEQL